MKEHPIIFSSSMIRAILEGRKTQTRRPIKPQPELAIMHRNGMDALKSCIRDGLVPFYCNNPKWRWRGTHVMPWPSCMIKWCPFGKSGDWLFVREKFSVCYHGQNFADVIYATDRERKTFPITSWIENAINQHGEALRSPIHMPRWASRITLEIVNVRVERLRDIQISDAAKEGWPEDPRGNPLIWFSELWDSIYSKKGMGWSINPYVWVIEFTRIT